MGVHSITLPDVGEGIAEAELVEWSVKVGDTVLEDEVVGAVMTDKAAVEIPSSVTGKVIWLGGEVGDVIAVGAELLRLEVEGEGNQGEITAVTVSAQPSQPVDNNTSLSAAVETPQQTPNETPDTNESNAAAAVISQKPLAAPSVRKKAMDLGIDLRTVTGSGPAGRVVHEDIDALQSQAPSGGVNAADTTITELNDTHGDRRPKLTVLPFMMKAIVEAVREQPQLNARYDDEQGVIHQYGGVHIGIATQTEAGLMVPVVRHCETLSLWDSAGAVVELAESSRAGSASRDELSGSTITITSLGPLGAIATTPIINHPEVAIVGINKIAVRPQWDGQQFVPKKMMNISASFDHRVIDGWDAAVMVQKLKTLLEKPAMLFVGD
jgi:2-oxoisovalerate dehydrogenase E2 component (dihydrolipoyl transacylase)